MISFRTSRIIGEEKEIVDFMPQLVGWGKWKNPDTLIECEYELDKDGKKIINDEGEVSVRIKKNVNLSYEDGNGNPHTVKLTEGTYYNVNPLLIVEEDC